MHKVLLDRPIKKIKTYTGSVFNTILKFLRKYERFVKYAGLAFVSLLFAFFFFTSARPLYPELGFGYDSYIFTAMGRQMAEGQVLYRDMFDHKGPFIFILNAIPKLFGAGISGIWFIEVIFLFAAFIFIDKTVCLAVKKHRIPGSLLAILSFITLLCFTADKGNLTEEYALLPSFVSLYIFIKYIYEKPQSIKTGHGFLLGALFSFVFLTRANNAMFICCIVLFFIAAVIMRKQYDSLWKNALSFLGGTFTVFIPVLIYLAANHAIGDFLYASFLYNVSAEKNFDAGRWSNNQFIAIVILFSVLFVAAQVVTFLNKKQGVFVGANTVRPRNDSYGRTPFASTQALSLICIIFSSITYAALIFSAFFSPYQFSHYLTNLAPAAVWYLIQILLYLDSVDFRFLLISKKIAAAALAIFLILFMRSVYLNYCRHVKYYNDYDFKKQDNAVLELVPENDRGSLYGYNVTPRWFATTGQTFYHKYWFQQEFFSRVNPEIKTEIEVMMRERPPKYILIQGDTQEDMIISPFLKNYYEIFAEPEGYVIYRFREMEEI